MSLIEFRHRSVIKIELMIKEVSEMNTEEIKQIKEAFRFLEQNNGSISANAASFVTGLKKYFARKKVLSERQLKALYEIKRFYPFRKRCYGGNIGGFYNSKYL